MSTPWILPNLVYVMKLNKIHFILLFLLFSHSVWSETFDLVCDTPLQRNVYRFDTETNQVSKIGYYSYDDGNYFENSDITVYNTISWDTEEEYAIWVTSDYTQPNYGDVLYTNMRYGTILTIVFDLHYKNITYTLLTRVAGRVRHYNSARKRCYSR